MTIEELLKPRWKVIADFPCNVGHDVGEIISEYKYKSEPDCCFIEIDLDGKIFGICPDDYPHLFRKLKWWEEREIEDMPNYIRVEHTIPLAYYQNLNGVYKVGEYISDGFIPDKGDGIKSISFNKWVFPATEQEYLNQ